MKRRQSYISEPLIKASIPSASLNSPSFDLSSPPLPSFNFSQPRRAIANTSTTPSWLGNYSPTFANSYMPSSSSALCSTVIEDSVSTACCTAPESSRQQAPSPFQIFRAWENCHATEHDSSGTLYSPVSPTSPISLSGAVSIPPSPALSQTIGVFGLQYAAGSAGSAASDGELRNIGIEVWSRLCRLFEEKHFAENRESLVESADARSPTMSSKHMSALLDSGDHGLGISVICDTLLLGCKFDSGGRLKCLLDETLENLYRMLYPINQFSSATRKSATACIAEETVDCSNNTTVTGSGTNSNMLLLLYHMCAIATCMQQESTRDTFLSPLALAEKQQQRCAFGRNSIQLQCTVFAFSLLLLYWISRDDFFLQGGEAAFGSAVDISSLQYMMEMYSPAFRYPVHSAMVSQSAAISFIDIIPHLQRLVWTALLYPKLCGHDNDGDSKTLGVFKAILEKELYSNGSRVLGRSGSLASNSFDLEALGKGSMECLSRCFYEALASIYQAIFSGQFRLQLQDISSYIWELSNKNRIVTMKQDLILLLLEPFHVLGEVATVLARAAQAVHQKQTECKPGSFLPQDRPSYSSKPGHPINWTDWVLPINSISKAEFEDEIFFPLLWDSSIVDDLFKVNEKGQGTAGPGSGNGGRGTADCEFSESTRLHNTLKNPAKMYRAFHPATALDLSTVYTGIILQDQRRNMAAVNLSLFGSSVPATPQQLCHKRKLSLSPSQGSCAELVISKRRRVEGSDTNKVPDALKRRHSSKSPKKGHHLAKAEASILSKLFLGCSFSLESCASSREPGDNTRQMVRSSPQRTANVQPISKHHVVDAIDLESLRCGSHQNVTIGSGVSDIEPGQQSVPTLVIQPDSTMNDHAKMETTRSLTDTGTVTTLPNVPGSWVMSRSILKKPAPAPIVQANDGKTCADLVSDIDSILSANSRWWIANQVSSASLLEEDIRENGYELPNGDACQSCFYPTKGSSDNEVSEEVENEQHYSRDTLDLRHRDDWKDDSTCKGHYQGYDRTIRGRDSTKKKKKKVCFKIEDEIIHESCRPSDFVADDGDVDMESEDADISRRPSFVEMFEPVNNDDSDGSDGQGEHILAVSGNGVNIADESPENADGHKPVEDTQVEESNTNCEEEPVAYDTLKTTSTRSFDSVASTARFACAFDTFYSPGSDTVGEGAAFSGRTGKRMAFNESVETITEVSEEDGDGDMSETLSSVAATFSPRPVHLYDEQVRTQFAGVFGGQMSFHFPPQTREILVEFGARPVSGAVAHPGNGNPLGAYFGCPRREIPHYPSRTVGHFGLFQSSPGTPGSFASSGGLFSGNSTDPHQSSAATSIDDVELIPGGLKY